MTLTELGFEYIFKSKWFQLACSFSKIGKVDWEVVLLHYVTSCWGIFCLDCNDFSVFNIHVPQTFVLIVLLLAIENLKNIQ